MQVGVYFLREALAIRRLIDAPLNGDSTINNDILTRDGFAQDECLDLLRDIFWQSGRLECGFVGCRFDFRLRELIAPSNSKSHVNKHETTHTQKDGEGRRKTYHSVIINPGLTLLHLTLLPQIMARPFMR